MHNLERIAAFVIGLIVMAICTGSAGWLVLGMGLVIGAMTLP